MDKKKIVRLTALVGVATVTGVVGKVNTTYADTKPSSATTNQAASDSVKRTQAAVNDAESNVNSAQDSVISASANVSRASTALDSAFTNKAQATSANIDTANSAVASQAAEVSAASQAVSDRSAVVSAASVAKDSAQAQANSASASAASAFSNMASASNVMSAAKAALTSDQATADRNLASATSAVSTASAAVSSQAAKVSTDQAAVGSAQAAVNEAKAALSEAEANQDVNMISFSTAYINALKAYIKNPTAENDAALEKVAGGADYVTELQKQFKFYDKLNVKVDPNSSEIQAALAIYATNLINRLRNQEGLTAFSTSANANTAALAFIQKYYNDANWNIFGATLGEGKGHNTVGLTNYANEINANMGEDVGSGLTTWVHGKATTATTTLNNLFFAVYSDIATMLFNDGGANQWSHVKSLAENGKISDVNFNNVYVGVAVDKYGYIHYELFNATNENKLAENAYKLNGVTEGKALLVSAQDRLAKAKETLATSQASLQSLQNKLSQAQDAVVAAQNQVDALKGDGTSAQAAIKAAQAQLNSAQAAYQAAMAEANQKQAALASADNELIKAQAALTSAEETLTAAKKKLVALQNRATELTNASQLLADAKLAYNRAIAQLEVATSNLEAAQVVLAKAEAQHALAQDAAQQAANRAAIAQQVDQQIKAITKQGVNVATEIKTTAAVAGSRAVTTTVAVANATDSQRLPQTGNDTQEVSAIALAGLGMFGATAGLYGLKKRKELTK
jgi:trimeric autotransporter adhesin